MKIDIFCEMQKPRPWNGDHEHQIIEETFEQAQLADEMGYDCWWQVEHHTVEEFSYSSAPELMLTAIARGTKRLRVGHAAVLTPYNFNHPMRLAERGAFLDHLSEGRFEMGFARSTGAEWEVFNVDPDDTRRQLQQTMEMVPKMWTQERFSWKSEDFDIRDRVVVPKPYQKPHPPLWQACSSQPSWEQAGRNGFGVLGVTLWTPIEAIAERVEAYREAIKQADPLGEVVNDQIALFTFVHCADTEQQAMENGAAEAAAWYTNSAFTFFQPSRTDAAGGDFVGTFEQDRQSSDWTPDAESEAEQVIARVRAGESVPDEEIYGALAEHDGLIVGDPDQCRQKMKKYEELGIDRLMCFQQVGHLTHDSVMQSIRLVGGLIPEFAAAPTGAAAR